MKTDLIDPDAVETLCALFAERVRRSPDALAYRHYDAGAGAWRDLSWSDMATRVRRWQAAMEADGLVAGDRVAIMLPNGPDWVCFDLAALGLGLTVVPLFYNDRPDNVAYIVERTAARLLLIEGSVQWEALAPALAAAGPARIVLRDGGARDDGRLVALGDWLPAQPGGELRVCDAGRNALATIVHTSGTIGRPKGVMLTHGNILWNAWASHRSNAVYRDDLFLSFLPLSHMLERTVGYYLPMMAGASVAYARSVAQLAEDLPLIRPTALISVPRIYERIYGRIQSEVAGRPGLARRIFRRAVEVGWSRFECAQGRGRKRADHAAWPLFERLVARKVLARLGGRIRIAVCGGAPLQQDVAQLFIGLGLPIVQGYGMTELGPVVSGNSLADNLPASVGRPLEGVEIRVSGEGELLVRSPGRMTGYLDDPEATAQTIDADGWLHTGDLAEVRDGRLYITGRLKDIIVMSNGEKVSPGDMEMAIMRDPLIEQAMIAGEGRPFLTAFLVIEPSRWDEVSEGLGLSADDPAALRDPRLLDRLCMRVGERLREFPGYAQVRRVAVTLEPWTVENGMLTPTLKLRRAQVLERMADVLARLYEGH